MTHESKTLQCLHYDVLVFQQVLFFVIYLFFFLQGDLWLIFYSLSSRIRVKSYLARENLSHASNAHIYGYLGVRIPLYGTSIYQMNEIPFLS